MFLFKTVYILENQRDSTVNGATVLQSITGSMPSIPFGPREPVRVISECGTKNMLYGLWVGSNTKTQRVYVFFGV